MRRQWTKSRRVHLTPATVSCIFGFYRIHNHFIQRRIKTILCNLVPILRSWWSGLEQHCAFSCFSQINETVVLCFLCLMAGLFVLNYMALVTPSPSRINRLFLDPQWCWVRVVRHSTREEKILKVQTDYGLVVDASVLQLHNVLLLCMPFDETRNFYSKWMAHISIKMLMHNTERNFPSRE